MYIARGAGGVGDRRAHVHHPAEVGGAGALMRVRMRKLTHARARNKKCCLVG